ncbi:hypothetical protein QBC45DRAFT_394004 [Copromyces sp. CBS 386.78]|nr:hypothetical protein QBC45DRAFT_394004 [Copromyces sp. CBS 386.78]
MAARREWEVKVWGVADKTSVPFEISEIYYPIANRVQDCVEQFHTLRANLNADMEEALLVYERGVEAIKECKRQYDAALEEMATVHNLPNRAQRISEHSARQWLVYWHTPDYWTESLSGLRMEIVPGPKHKWHNEWRERLMTAEAAYGPQGPPPRPPSNPLPHWVGRNHPQPLFIPQQQAQQEQARQEHQAHPEQQEQAGSAEAGPSRPAPQPVGNLEEAATSLSGSSSALNASSNDHLPGQPSSRSPTPGPSDTDLRPPKLDKGKGKAVDTTHHHTTTVATATVGSSSTSAAAPVTVPSTSDVVGPSVTGNDTIEDTATTTNNTTITATAREEESTRETAANNAEDKSTINVQTRPTRIKIITPGTKKDLKGKSKAVDTNNPNNSKHKVIKPTASVAKRETIKRSQVFKGKYWVFKLDSSMFTQKGTIRKEFVNGKGKRKATAAASANVNVNDNDESDGEEDNGGEGSSKPTATTSTDGNDDNGHNESDKISDDELALDANSDSSDKKNAATAVNRSTTTAATTVASASSSSSSSNKRKRTVADTGDDEADTGEEEPEDPNAYYVLRCPLDDNCMTESNCTHNAPASIKGVFCRHPFKRRRAMDHIKACGLQGQIVSEKQIWKNYCRKVVEDRPQRPVDDAWAKRHNGVLISKLVKQAEGTKEEKEMMRKEMEEEL